MNGGHQANPTALLPKLTLIQFALSVTLCSLIYVRHCRWLRLRAALGNNNSLLHARPNKFNSLKRLWDAYRR